jgi:hypothetical protein
MRCFFFKSTCFLARLDRAARPPLFRMDDPPERVLFRVLFLWDPE